MSKEKSIQEKFKQFFKINRGASLQKSNSDEYVIITEELEGELNKDSPPALRIKAIKQLNDVSKKHKLENFSLEKLWTLLNDLLKPESPKELRHTVLELFTSLCQNQTDEHYKKNGILRANLFNFIKNHNIKEDFQPKFQFLNALTENGKDISYFDEKIGPFILNWLIQSRRKEGAAGDSNFDFDLGVKTKDFMEFVVTLIKYNQSFIDQDILLGIIQNVCLISCTCSSKEDSLECLNVLEAAIAYRGIPPNCLSTFLATLCKTVNVEALCQKSWKIMRNFLGTDLGHSGLLIMCQFMEMNDPSSNNNHNNQIMDVAVIRGAVFFTGTSLWGSKFVRSLKYTPSTVLSSFNHALETRHPLIIFEVITRLQDLVKNKSSSLESISWDLIIEITDKVIEYSRPNENNDNLADFEKIMGVVNETLDFIETIVDTGNYYGTLDKFYSIIDASASFRKESSVTKLLEYKSIRTLNSSCPNWLFYLTEFMEQHYREETRPKIKVKALQKMSKICLLNRETHEEDLIERVILPNLKTLDQENDSFVRQVGVKFIVDFMMESSASKKGHELIHILEKILNRPYDNYESQVPGDTIDILSEGEVADVKYAVIGLIKLFERKIYHLPSSIAVNIYKILTRNLQTHYKKPVVLEHHNSIRYEIFKCFFRIRANSLYHLGFPRENQKEVTFYSPYLAVDHREGDTLDQSTFTTNATTPTTTNIPGEFSDLNLNKQSEASASGFNSSSSSLNASQIQVQPSGTLTEGKLNSTATTPPPPSSQPQSTIIFHQPTVTFVSFTIACKLVVSSLKKEKDWKILELVLKEVPQILENKALILSKNGNDIDYLADNLCSLLLNKNLHLPESLRNVPCSVPTSTTPAAKLNKTEFLSYLFPILTALVSYHSHLDSTVQQKIVKCLVLGLVSKCPRVCILSLSICALEMKDTMHKLLPEVLLSLSKITPKVEIAIPVLEFLSTLIHLPRVFASFVQEQYLSIFAIALPYTNPFKFKEYTVSLAHHVIALWFLKCRLSFRRGFVSYIIKGLESNVLARFEEESRKVNLSLANEDSSNRKRSSSLTDNTRDNIKRRERPISGCQIDNNNLNKPHMDKARLTFHQELTETAVDLMARYAFADCSALPTRFPSTSFLLNEGSTSATWLVDNKIITITTSGCTQKELRNGLCDKCWLICSKKLDIKDKDDRRNSTSSTCLSEETGSEKSLETSNNSSRRRHRSAFESSFLSNQMNKKNNFDLTENEKDSSTRLLSNSNLKSLDDFHLLQNKLQRGKDEINERQNDLTNPSKSKSEHLCTCFCQGWAEVYIRRPTGNTSWIMRVQNEIGNFTTNNNEMLLKELSSFYLQKYIQKQEITPVETPLTSSNSDLKKDSSSSNSNENEIKDKALNATPADQIKTEELPSSSTTINKEVKEPTLVSDSSSNSNTEQNQSKKIEDTENNEEKTEVTESESNNSKNQVRRSNSSPEMSNNLKKLSSNSSHVNTDNIEEQDEQTTASRENLKELNIPPSDSSLSSNSNNTKQDGNSTSPFRGSYEIIPEEIISTVPEDKIPKEKAPLTLMMSQPPQPSPQQSPIPEETDLSPIKRDRLSTISVMTPARRNPPSNIRRYLSISNADIAPFSNPRNFGLGKHQQLIEQGRSGISPSFIFLQLCAQGVFGQIQKPLLIPSAMDKSIKVIDYIPPYETFKIGVLYVGPGQENNETAILQNQFGSTRYRNFLQGLGTLIKLKEVDPQKTFTGGLSRDGNDGEFAYIWQDDVMQVIFHVSTLMPNKPNDPSGNAKKLHIGNDFVAVVYNNSEQDFDINTIKAQFLYACIVIQPLDHGTNRVILKTKPVLTEYIGYTENKIVSDQNLSIMARQISLHANLASLISQSLIKRESNQNPAATFDPYASNWLERLRKIKKLKMRLYEENPSLAKTNSSTSSSQQGSTTSVDDFTDYA